MTNTNTQPPDGPEWEPSTPDPRWQPRDADDVQGLYGPNAAKAWLNASEERRRGIIRHLMQYGTGGIRDEQVEEEKKREKEPDAFQFDIDFGEVESDMQRLDDQRAATFMPEMAEVASLLKAQEKYERQIGEWLAKDPGTDKNEIRRTNIAIARRRLQSHMVQCLLDGELTFAACMKRVLTDPVCIELSKQDRIFEYDTYLDLLIDRGQVTMLHKPR